MQEKRKDWEGGGGRKGERVFSLVRGDGGTARGKEDSFLECVVSKKREGGYRQLFPPISMNHKKREGKIASCKKRVISRSSPRCKGHTSSRERGNTPKTGR